MATHDPASRATRIATDAPGRDPLPWARWTVAPLLLVVATLVGSVVVPARQTWRILGLLRQTTEVVEPARRLQARIESGITLEAAALQGYVLSRDIQFLVRYRSMIAEDDRSIAQIQVLARRLDPGAVDLVDALQRPVAAWRQIDGRLPPGAGPRPQNDAFVRAQHADYAAALRAIARLGSYLEAEASERREEVRAAERLSIAVNGALVLVALAAMLAVFALSRRERRLTLIQRQALEEARRHARQERALREAAEQIVAAFTTDEIMQAIARTAVDATQASGAFIEQIESAADVAGGVVVVRAAAGADTPPLGTMAPYAGSCAEIVLRGGEPLYLPQLASAPAASLATGAGAGRSAIVVPLGRAGMPIGALFLLGAPGAAFDPDDLARARTFGHLAGLACEKVMLLEEARAGRRELERVMESRSRLMRGFSHDVKNPLGAASGFADILAEGMLGELTAEQKLSLERMRACIRSALALIDDLHQLARMESGHVTLLPERLDLSEVARRAGEEYGAWAEARGLVFAVDAAAPVSVETDRARVGQIVGNLLSNAIKYTPAGSVTLRVGEPAAEAGPQSGAWGTIEVLDTGVGIPPEQREAIFEEFTRLGGDDTPGAGLGLAISQKLAQALGGRITVRSEVGLGSAFTLWLPLANADGRSRLGASTPPSAASV